MAGDRRDDDNALLGTWKPKYAIQHIIAIVDSEDTKRYRWPKQFNAAGRQF